MQWVWKEDLKRRDMSMAEMLIEEQFQSPTPPSDRRDGRQTRALRE